MRFKQGFTLIEVMITVAIIAILAAIAVPNYTDYVTRSKFSRGHGTLGDLRVKMEQYYMDNRRYSTTRAAAPAAFPAAIPPTVRTRAISPTACASTAANAAGDQQYMLTASGIAGARAGRHRLHPEPRERHAPPRRAPSWRPRATPPAAPAGCGKNPRNAEPTAPAQRTASA